MIHQRREEKKGTTQAIAEVFLLHAKAKKKRMTIGKLFGLHAKVIYLLFELTCFFIKAVEAAQTEITLIFTLIIN